MAASAGGVELKVLMGAPRLLRRGLVVVAPVAGGAAGGGEGGGDWGGVPTAVAAAAAAVVASWEGAQSPLPLPRGSGGVSVVAACAGRLGVLPRTLR